MQWQERLAIKTDGPPTSLDTKKQLDNDDTHQYLVIQCTGCGHRHRVMQKCGSRTCPKCRRREFYRLFNGYKEQVRRKPPHTLKFLTLTVKNRETLEGGVEDVRAAFKELRRRQLYKRAWHGGIYAIEAVNKGRGWHVHLHAIVEGRYIQQQRIAADWLDITGDSQIVDIRECRNGEDTLRYLLKYITKRPECAGYEDEYNQTLKGKRLVHAFGLWYGNLKLELPQLACPDCGGTSWQMEWDLTLYYATVRKVGEERGP